MKITTTLIREYIEKFDAISVPQLQLHFNLPYSDARKAIQDLEDKGIIKYNSGILFDVIQSSIYSISSATKLAIKKQCKKPTDDTDSPYISGGDEIRKSQEDLERRKAEILARLRAQMEQEEDDDYDED